MAIRSSEQLTPREYEEMNFQKEMLERSQAHAIKMKELEIEVEKVSARFNAWFKLPALIILLPVRILFVIALITAIVCKRDDLEKFWDVLKY